MNYSSLQKDFARYQEIGTIIKSVDKEIASLEDMLRQVESFRLDREKINAQITTIQETMKFNTFRNSSSTSQQQATRENKKSFIWRPAGWLAG